MPLSDATTQKGDSFIVTKHRSKSASSQHQSKSTAEKIKEDSRGLAERDGHLSPSCARERWRASLPWNVPASGSRARSGDTHKCVCPAPGTRVASGARGARLGVEGSMQALPRRAPLCRPAAHAALSSLRASRWIDRSTRTVSVHFALYNPPTRLLSSVSLRAELLPAGGLTFSPLVESLAVFRSDSALWSSPTLAEVGPPASPLHVDPGAPPAACSPPPPGPAGSQSPALSTVSLSLV